MARYFFHLWTGEHWIVDRNGGEFEDLAAAERAAASHARDSVVVELLGDREPDGRHFEIVDDRGETISTVQFRDLGPALEF